MATRWQLASWNVNGIRAVVKKGFTNFLHEYHPDVLGLQEIKISHAAREETEFDFAGYEECWNPAERPGYAGTAVLTTKKPLSVSVDGIAGDREGRLQTVEFEKFYFLNCYFPNANHELSRLPFKEEFNKKFLAYVKKLEKKKPVVACGDFNVAHHEIDIARPKENVGNAGFTAEERHWADEFVAHGLVDSFRELHPKKIQYSWWSYRALARERNIGWRIDYFFVSKKLVPHLVEAHILDEVEGSDHCPVTLTLSI